MKHRILVFILCAALLLPCLVFPASAAEGDFTFQVLDYSLPNGGTTRLVNITSGASVYFDLPQSATYYYVDMLIRSDTDLNSVICDANGISLTVQKINDNSASLYRVYGDINGWTLSRISFSFHFTTGSALIFESFRISTLRLVRETVPTQFSGSIPGDDDTERINFDFHFTGNTELTSKFYDHVYVLNDVFYSYLTIDSWKNYDYIDIYLTLAVGELNSITAQLAGSFIPFEVNYIDDPDIYFTDFNVHIRLDLSNVDRSINDILLVSITGITATQHCLWALCDVTGYYVAAEPSPWMYWFGKLGGWISDQTAAIHSWGSSIVNSISTWGQNIVNAITGGETDTSAADELKQQAQQMQDFEQSQQAVLENGIGDLQTSVNFLAFANALAFVSTYTNSIFKALGDYQIIFTLPLTLGFILFLCSRVPYNTKPKKNDENGKDARIPGQKALPGKVSHVHKE